MKELLQQLIDKGFISATESTADTLYIYIYILTQTKHKDIRGTYTLLLLEEIKHWFRTEHNIIIHLSVTHDDKETPVLKWYYEVSNREFVNVNSETWLEDYDSYELTLLEGIKEAIKLI